MFKPNEENTYYIDFNTKEIPDHIVAVKVVLTSDVLRASDDKFRIDLCKHPLYEKLCNYVINNPPRKDKG